MTALSWHLSMIQRDLNSPLPRHLSRWYYCSQHNKFNTKDRRYQLVCCRILFAGMYCTGELQHQLTDVSRIYHRRFEGRRRSRFVRKSMNSTRLHGVTSKRLLLSTNLRVFNLTKQDKRFPRNQIPSTHIVLHRFVYWCWNIPWVSTELSVEQHNQRNT
jgi:hypothetical protein